MFDVFMSYFDLELIDCDMVEVWIKVRQMDVSCIVWIIVDDQDCVIGYVQIMGQYGKGWFVWFVIVLVWEVQGKGCGVDVMKFFMVFVCDELQFWKLFCEVCIDNICVMRFYVCFVFLIVGMFV